MKCKDLIKLIQEQHIEDYEVIWIDIEDNYDSGNIIVMKNYEDLPCPEYKDFFWGDGPAYKYDRTEIEVDMKDCSFIKRSDDHFDSSSESNYPW